MNRLLLLIVGPVLLIGGSYCVTVGRSRANDDVARGVERPPEEFDIAKLEAGAKSGLANTNDESESSSDSISLACDKRARELARYINNKHSMIVRPPFVLAGDVSEQELDRHYRSTILPTVRALQLQFFDFQPVEPITILMYGSEDKYLAAAKRLDRRNGANYYGYYIRPDRRIVLNIGTGAGTLSHELTHALAHFDFPQMPEWFDEGLAAVYEEADFTDDGLQLVGVSNWRLNHLLHAMQKRRLQSLEALVSARKIRATRKAIDYAHARYLCLFLQDRGLLPHFYRKFKANAKTDKSGLRTLCEIFGTDTLDPVDREFRQWVIKLYKEVRGLAALYLMQNEVRR